jgi:hypothetical protein
MIKKIKVSSYEEFEQKVVGIFRGIEEKKNDNPGKCYSYPLFRGQKNSSWTLKTTLERYIEHSEYPYLDYLQKMKNVQKYIYKYFGKKFKLNKTFAEGNFNNFSNIPNEEEYKCMAYLRHHGFPSPLLDWTSSMEIASFFAFREPSDEENVAVYVYITDIGCGEAWWSGKPKINYLGPNITADERHENQKSEYTMSLRYSEEREIICNHEDALGNEKYLDKKFKKFLIPSCERKKVLKKLEKSGINAYTLFKDEDSLMEWLRIKEFYLSHGDV